MNKIEFELHILILKIGEYANMLKIISDLDKARSDLAKQQTGLYVLEGDLISNITAAARRLDNETLALEKEQMAFSEEMASSRDNLTDRERKLKEDRDKFEEEVNIWNKAKKEVTHRKVKLNVGGVPMETTTETLTSKSLYFQALFSGVWKENIEIFIDYDPDLFKELLTYMRTNLYPISNKDYAEITCNHFGVDFPKAMNMECGPIPTLPTRNRNAKSILTDAIAKKFGDIVSNFDEGAMSSDEDD